MRTVWRLRTVGGAVSLEEGESWAKCELSFDGVFSFS